MASAAAEDKTETTGNAAAAASGSGSGGNKLVLILTLVNTVVTVGIIAILLVSLKQQKAAPNVADIKVEGEAKPHGEEKAEGHGETKAAEGHGGGGEHGKPQLKKPADFGKMVTLDQFTVNLSTPGSSSSKFVRVNVSLEVASDDTEAEVNAKMPQIRNVIIDLFNSKRVSDLSTADGRDYLREEIKNALNGFLVHGKVKGVFFTNFMLAS